MVPLMFFRRALWLFGVGRSLDGMRRGFIGGSALSLFIIKEFGLERQARPTLDYLRQYLEIEETILSQIPPFMSFLIFPFTDYHLAGQAYLQILETLAESQRPTTCTFYWKKGAP